MQLRENIMVQRVIVGKEFEKLTPPCCDPMKEIGRPRMDWHFCPFCGESIEWLTPVETEVYKAGK